MRFYYEFKKNREIFIINVSPTGDENDRFFNLENQLRPLTDLDRSLSLFMFKENQVDVYILNMQCLCYSI